MSDTDDNYYQIPESHKTYSGLDLDAQAAVEGVNLAAKDDVLKVSQKTQVTVTGFSAGKAGTHIEDGVDINNRCSDIVLADGYVGAGRKGVAVTIKGGARNVALIGLVITKPGKRCDIEIGNWSDQSWEPNTGISVINCSRSDGKKVRVAWGRGERPKLAGPAEIDWGRTVVLHLYVYAKHLMPFIP